MKDVLEKLKGGDLRSIGKADDVVSDILKNPELFAEVFDGMLSGDATVRMRSADAVEKVSRLHPELLKPFKKRLIEQISQIEQQEVRWHVAQMFSYLELDEGERRNLIHMLSSWIDSSRSKIVIVISMQTLADFAEQDSNVMYMKRTHRLGDFSSVKNGEPPIRLTRAAGSITYVLFWELDSDVTRGSATRSGLEHFFKDFRRCLVSTPKIILGERIQ